MIQNSNGVLDLTEPFLEKLESAEEYGLRMMRMYEEYMEYVTSRCEAIDIFLGELTDKVSNMDLSHIRILKIPNKFIEEVKEKGCAFQKEDWDKFIGLFSACEIEYT